MAGYGGINDARAKATFEVLTCGKGSLRVYYLFSTHTIYCLLGFSLQNKNLEVITRRSASVRIKVQPGS